MSNLDNHDLQWLVANSERQEIPAGSVLIRHLASPSTISISIVAGSFDVIIPAPVERKVARLYPGELIGEMFFVDFPHLPPLPSAQALKIRVCSPCIQGWLMDPEDPNRIPASGHALPSRGVSLAALRWPPRRSRRRARSEPGRRSHRRNEPARKALQRNPPPSPVRPACRGTLTSPPSPIRATFGTGKP